MIITKFREMLSNSKGELQKLRFGKSNHQVLVPGRPGEPPGGFWERFRGDAGAVWEVPGEGLGAG